MKNIVRKVEIRLIFNFKHSVKNRTKIESGKEIKAVKISGFLLLLPLSLHQSISLKFLFNWLIFSHHFKKSAFDALLLNMLD